MRAPLTTTLAFLLWAGASADAAVGQSLRRLQPQASPVRAIEARLERGFRWFEGRWRLPQEIEYLERARSARTAPAVTPDSKPETAKLVATGPIDAAWFLARSARDAASARDTLRRAAQRAGDRNLEHIVVREWLGSHLARGAAPRGGSVASTGFPVGILSLNLQHSQLEGFDIVPVSFGSGQGRIMLPRTRSISIGTTVAVPLGR